MNLYKFYNIWFMKVSSIKISTQFPKFCLPGKTISDWVRIRLEYFSSLFFTVWGPAHDRMVILSFGLFGDRVTNICV